MTDIAIQVENLSKRYRIGTKEERHDTLLGGVSAWLKAPLTNYRKLRQLSTFSENGRHPEDIIWALKDVSFTVKKGEVVGIIGRNGAGKSTLLKILSRITEPTGGRAVLNGRISSLLEVGTGFHPELTGRENVYLNGTILGMSKKEIERKFDEIVDFSGVEKFIDTPVKRYSSGMQVRLAFAVAAHLEPEILMIDEVLAVGDIEFQKKCLGKMGDVAGEGRTILFVSHNMAYIEALCRKAVWINNGKLIKVDVTNEVIQAYAQTSIPDIYDQTPDLKSFTRPKGKQPLIVEAFLNSNPLQGHHIIPPMSKLEFDLSVNAPQQLHDCILAIHFDNEFGTCLFSVNTKLTLKRFNLNNGLNNIRCQINDLPLVPGIYYLTLWFVSAENIGDTLNKVAHLEVIRSDVYGTGELPENGHGYYLGQANWQIENR